MNAKNKYHGSNHRFAPTPIEEAQFLLRRVKRYGHADPTLAALPEPLASLICGLDKSIPDGHDDPQNFDLVR